MTQGRTLIVLIDGDAVAEWKRRALALLPASDRLIILTCTNTQNKVLLAKHPLYYALNLVSVRNPLTRQVPVGAISAQIVERSKFQSVYEGAWQRLPDDVITMINDRKPDAIIKLGLGLMRVPPEIEAPILSWHHGDPDHYRGRPAGFYEMQNGARRIGQIVQVISNKLDAGSVVAFAETRVIDHSWRATLMEAFRLSPLLLEPALRNAIARRPLEKASNGKNYRLPPNTAVAGAVIRMARAGLRRLAYGAFVEKRWMVSTASIDGPVDAIAIACGQVPFPAPETWRDLACPDEYSFLADPFFAPDGRGILVEALGRKSGKGEIVLFGDHGHRRVSIPDGHHSYPASIEQGDEIFVVPEIAGWSPPIAYRLTADSLEAVAALDIEGAPHLLDPTFFCHAGRLWLFANDASIGSNALFLWSADNLFSRFERHPQGPICMSPRGARMAGNILIEGDRLVRVGQSFEDGYGDGLFAFEIDVLSVDAYLEREMGGLRLSGLRGPHSFNISPDGRQIVFDWYRETTSLFAGWRRLRGRLG